MVVGLSGSGKSSTINHLFGVEIAATSNTCSETRSTSEYVVTSEDPTLDVTNLTLVTFCFLSASQNIFIFNLKILFSLTFKIFEIYI